MKLEGITITVKPVQYDGERYNAVRALGYVDGVEFDSGLVTMPPTSDPFILKSTVGIALDRLIANAKAFSEH